MQDHGKPYRAAMIAGQPRPVFGRQQAPSRRHLAKSLAQTFLYNLGLFGGGASVAAFALGYFGVGQ